MFHNMIRVSWCVALAMTMALTSCFKDEPLNAEADIERVVVNVAQPEQLFFQITDTARDVLSTDNNIVFTVRGHADLTALAPRLVLTPGATVEPASGSVHDFSNGPVTYVVTSQDGRWQRRYTIAFQRHLVIVNDTIKYDFEHFELEPAGKKYYIWYNQDAAGQLVQEWASGNPGYKIARATAKPDEYPTIPLTEGYEGYGVKLITRDTGPFGKMSKKPIAAGNLFLGEFDMSKATTETLKSTRFGLPFTKRPAKYTGYYKYTAGDTYKDKDGNVVPGKKDVGSIYAVLYRNHDAAGNEVMLFGDDVQTNPNIVAIAKVKDLHETTEWTAFEVPFEYSKEVDEQLLENRGYSLTVVFSASVDGDLFIGAIGSTLCVDKVRVICTHEE